MGHKPDAFAAALAAVRAATAAADAARIAVDAAAAAMSALNAAANPANQPVASGHDTDHVACPGHSRRNRRNPLSSRY